ncbi:hypothetical protein [Streptomyces sp. NPDC002553]
MTTTDEPDAEPDEDPAAEPPGEVVCAGTATALDDDAPEDGS